MFEWWEKNLNFSLISKLKEHISLLDLSPPSYQQITCIINRMKSPELSCLLDQTLMTCFKRRSYLRIFMLDICAEVFRRTVDSQHNEPQGEMGNSLL